MRTRVAWLLRAGPVAAGVVAAWLLAVGVLAGWALVVGAPPGRADERDPLPPVRWDADAEAAGRRVQTYLPQALARARHAVGGQPDLGGAEVFVVRGVERMRSAARAHVPDWAAGVTVAGLRIVLRADPAPGASGDLEATLRHEAVHLLWARRAGPRVRSIPLWFEEGLAEQLAGRPTLTTGARLSVAAGLGQLLDFGDLERRWPAATTDADLAYQQARGWMDVLAAQAGPEAATAVLDYVLKQVPYAGLAAGQVPLALDRALLHVTGHPLSDWHAEWRRSLSDQRGRWWLWFLTDLGGVLLAALAVVGMVAFAALRRRRRQQIEALPDDAPPGSEPPPES